MNAAIRGELVATRFLPSGPDNILNVLMKRDPATQWITYSIRYVIGARFTPGFRSRMSLRYMLEDEFNVVNPMQLHIVVLGYAYSF